MQARRPQTFDVICAGNPLWKMLRREGTGVRFESTLVEIARTLARKGVRVGLASVFDDDSVGRATVDGIAGAGVDVGGVKLAPPGGSLVVVDADGGQTSVVAERDPQRTLEVPAEWSSRVLLLTGLSPTTSCLAALCKAARKARRDGSSVVLDMTSNLRTWAGHEPRLVSMLLRETDMVRASFAELATLGLDTASVRSAMRPSAALVLSDPGGVSANGPFGDVRCTPARGRSFERGGESCTAAICVELARPRKAVESAAARWHRVLEEWTSLPFPR